jgi:SAM-dependent methyltransferase
VVRCEFSPSATVLQMKTIDAIMSRPFVYRLWMAPFAEDKFARVLRHNDLGAVRRVLDVGCGPGTNASYFLHSEYLGIDLNTDYIESAKRRYRRRFLAADAAEFVSDFGERFDFILVNSFLHHLDTPTTRRILSNLHGLLTPDGHIHILELVLPRSASVARFLAHADRGKFARPLEEWEGIFDDTFNRKLLEPYTLSLFGAPLYHMVYFKGGIKPE